MSTRRCSLLAALALAALSACNKATPSPEAKPTNSSATAAASAAPPAKAKPWYSGGFSGQYEAKLAPVEIKVGGVREWAADDGKAASGPGKLTLKIDDDGVVEGSSEGALGASLVSGKVEDDTLRVEFAPTDETGLRGVLVASRDGEGFKGSLQASSGDSLRVRQASVELKKQAN